MTGDREARDRLGELLGGVGAEKAAAILELNPTPEELETAWIWASAKGGVVEGEPLSGKTARIYDILSGGESKDG